MIVLQRPAQVQTKNAICLIFTLDKSLYNDIMTAFRAYNLP